MFDRLQQQQEEIRRALAAARVEAVSGDGWVTVRMSGDRKVTDISIREDHPLSGDLSALEDHLTLAVNDALEQVTLLEQETVREWMGKLLPGGMDGLKGIFGT
ncbi:MAG: YbaB/EbfC family nucleoid-associated protein [Saprospiraceae bacterium]|nr:YbaB/EbfC family nucleoid-associated protein [Saprospiraceae bacterium]